MKHKIIKFKLLFKVLIKRLFFFKRNYIFCAKTLGDTLYILKYYQDIQKKVKSELIIVFPSEYNLKVLSLIDQAEKIKYEVSNYDYMPEIGNLRGLIVLLKKILPVKNIHTEINIEKIGKMSMEELIKSNFGLQNEDKGVKVRSLYKLDQADKEKYGNSIVLFPHANTVKNFKFEFWDKLYFELKKMGYSPYFNGEIEGYECINYSIEKTISIINYSRGLIGLRSGFLDLCIESNIKKVILFPDEKKDEGTILEIFSFKRNWDKTIVEIEVKREKIAESIEQILKEFKGGEL